MTLRQKTLLIVGCAISVFSLILVFSANLILVGGFSQLEQQEAESSINRASRAVMAETESLNSFLADWSAWDDTYQFIAAPDPDFVKKNINAATFTSQQLDVMIFLDSAQNIVYSTAYDTLSKSFRPVPESLLSHLQPGAFALKHATPDSVVRGLIVLPESSVFIASRPVLDSEKQHPPRGVMVVGRFLSPSVLKNISDTTGLSLQFRQIGDPALPADFATVARTVSPTAPILIRASDENTVSGFVLLEDIYHKPALLLKIDMNRTIYAQGKKTVRYFLLLLFAFGILFGAANLLLLEKTILARLADLSRQVLNVGKNNSPELRVRITGRDELSKLANSINNMLVSLESTQNELKESEAATRALLEGLPDTLLRVDRKGVILDFKTARDRSAATPSRLLVGNVLADAYPDTWEPKLFNALEQAFATDSPQVFDHELSIHQKSFHQEIRVTRISTNEAIVIIRDSTERRHLEKTLQLYNLRDTLTGLFNRTYWDEKLAAANHMEESVGIILCDIDDMALINESLGRDRGNKLLVFMATAFRVSLPLEATIARVGDDEFAALLTGVTLADLEEFGRKILQEVEQSRQDDVHLRFGLSFGYAAGAPAQLGMQTLYHTAERNLHRNKLAHSQSARDEIFKTLQAALSTRDFVSHQHATRLWALGRPLAKSAELPNRHLHDFKLLTQFHDIGKVGLPDSLIFKQGPLSSEEMGQMQRHVEIGHRISQFIPALFPIADLILKHHEWWNGNGYPLGLRGEEIPLECRIFGIVDAYDAMTNDRPDRKALSGKEAAAELRRCAGSQFDPSLVEKFIEILGDDA